MFMRLFRREKTSSCRTRKNGFPKLKEGVLHDEYKISQLFAYLAKTTSREEIILKTKDKKIHKSIITESGEHRGFYITVDFGSMEIEPKDPVQIIFFVARHKLEGETSVWEINPQNHHRAVLMRPPDILRVSEQGRKACRVSPDFTSFTVLLSLTDTEFPGVQSRDVSITGASFTLQGNPSSLTEGASRLKVIFEYGDDSFELEGKLVKIRKNPNDPTERWYCVHFIQGTHSYNSQLNSLNNMVIDVQRANAEEKAAMEEALRENATADDACQ